MNEATSMLPQYGSLAWTGKIFIFITPVTSCERFERNEAAFYVKAFLSLCSVELQHIFKGSTEDISVNSDKSDLFSIDNGPNKGFAHCPDRGFT